MLVLELNVWVVKYVNLRLYETISIKQSPSNMVIRAPSLAASYYVRTMFPSDRISFQLLPTKDYLL